MTVVNLRVAERPSNPAGLWHILPTRLIRTSIENVQLTGQLGLITGPSGVGKSTACETAVKVAKAASVDTHDLDEPTIARVSMISAAKGLQPGLLRLAAGIGLSLPNHLGAHDVHDALVQRCWGPGSLIVLDEAQFMSDDLIHGIRSLWDELDQRGTPAGIMLAGTPDLAVRIKGRGRKAVAFEAFRGRLGINLQLASLDADDVTAICEHYGISETKSVALIRRAAAHSGCLHHVARILAQAMRVAAEGKPPTYAQLTQAAELAGLSS